MAKPVTEFYDNLSPEYRHNMGWDWEAVMREEGATLTRFLETSLDDQALLRCWTAPVESAPRQSAWRYRAIRSTLLT